MCFSLTMEGCLFTILQQFFSSYILPKINNFPYIFKCGLLQVSAFHEFVDFYFAVVFVVYGVEFNVEPKFLQDWCSILL